MPQVSTAPRIHVFPSWRSNPYLTMLYAGARAEGWQVDGTTRLPDLVRTMGDLRDGDILHIHWTQPITQARRNAEIAGRYLESFIAAADAAIARGVRLVWTVHNHLPHTTRHLDLELEVNRYLAARAWRVIQLNPHTREAVADLFDLRIADMLGNGLKQGFPTYLDPMRARIERLLADSRALHVADLAVNGDDVMRVLELAPGPPVRAALEALLEEVTEDPSRNTRDHLLARLRDRRAARSPRA